MANQMVVETSRVIDGSDNLCDDGSLALTENAEQNENIDVGLLEDLDSYWRDINDRLTISRMVSDSVIKGMVNAVTQEAAERIAYKELEVAQLRETLNLYQVGVDKNGFLGSPVMQHKLNGKKIGVSCSYSDAFVEHDKLGESLSFLRNVAREQFKKLKKDIYKIRGCGTSRKINSGSGLVGLGGILGEKVSEKWVDVDETLDSLRTTLDTVCKQVDDIAYLSKTSLYEWQLERDFQGEIEDTVVKNCLQSFQEGFEERLWNQNTHFSCNESVHWRERIKEISDLCQELNTISKSLSVSETGQLTSHGSFEVAEDCNNNKKIDNFHNSVSGNHIPSSTSLWEGNGKPEESITEPENLDAAQLKHLSKEDLVNYFKIEMTKMKRNHESRVEMITDKYFKLRRDYLKEKGSKDREFEIFRKKIPEVILKLDKILVESDKLPKISKDAESLSSLKERFDTLVLENHQLRDLLADKKREVKSLSSQVSDAEEKLSQHSLAEAKLLKLIEDLKCDREDAQIQASISEEVYECVLTEVADHVRCITEELDMEYCIMQETHELIFRQAAQNAEPASKKETEGLDMESIIMQGLLEILFAEAFKEANEKLNMSNIQYSDEKNFRVSLEMQALETEKALKQEIVEKERLNQEICLLAASLEEKEKFVLEAQMELAKVNERFELASKELNNLREQASHQQMVISESSKVSDIMKRGLVKALEQIEVQKMEICQLNQKLKQMDEERKMLHAAVQEKQNALSLLEVKERDHKEQMESMIFLVQGLSKALADFECRVTADIKINNLRLESMISQFNAVIQKANLLRRTSLLYKQGLERRCSDLEKAEKEVDLLGDEVDVLLSLLEKIYIALDHYSPVLKHYPGIMEILKLVRRELSGESTKSV